MRIHSDKVKGSGLRKLHGWDLYTIKGYPSGNVITAYLRKSSLGKDLMLTYDFYVASHPYSVFYRKEDVPQHQAFSEFKELAKWVSDETSIPYPEIWKALKLVFKYEENESFND